MEKLKIMKRILITLCLFSSSNLFAQTVPVDSVGIYIRAMQKEIATLKILKLDTSIIIGVATKLIKDMPVLVDTVKVLPGQAVINNVKNANGSNTGTIDLTLLWEAINGLKQKLQTGLTISGTAK